SASMPLPSFTLSLKATEAEWHGLALSDASCTLKGSTNGFELTRLSFGLGNGRVRASGESLLPNGAWACEGRARNIDASQVLATLGLPKGIAGTATLEWELAARSKEWAELARSIHGEGTLTLSGGRVPALKHIFPASSTKGISSLEASFALHQGACTLKAGLTAEDKTTGQVQATINLADGRLEGQASLKTGKKDISYGLAGSLANISVSPKPIPAKTGSRKRDGHAERKN
ncbi:MAG: AsmA-like C-terminal region-containing protein, partial [Comamonadaceae bacterium]|nr:AsmA-like C-terminal region-containing protein [Comamonadaceae bacterium]